MRVGVVANGVGVVDLAGLDQVIAVDGGLKSVKNPDLIVGDLDSVDPSLLKKIPREKIRKYPLNKELSDTEIAIGIAYGEMKADEVVLFSYFGNRVDHSLSNLFLLKKFPELIFKNGKETLFLLQGKMKLDLPIGTIVSLIPLSDQVLGVISEGLHWRLKGETLSKTFMSLSNVVEKSPVTLSAYSGDLLICVFTP